VTSDSRLSDTMKMLRDHGRDYGTKEGKYISTILGYNFRMSELSAALGRCQLKYIEQWSQKRRNIAEMYNESLTDKVIKPQAGDRRKHVYHLYVIRTGKRDELKEHLHRNDIETGIHYPVPVHRQPIFEDSRLPVTEKICDEILSLPIYPLLSDDQVSEVIDTINDFFE